MNSGSKLRENIKKLLIEKGWSQKTLAQHSGVSQKTISNLVAENGAMKSPSISTMEAIAQGLGVSEAELMGYTSDPNSSPDNELTRELPELIRDFITADSEGRKAIRRVARNEALSTKRI